MLSAARDAGAKVVFVGYPEQLQAIEAGAAFRSLAEARGTVEITEIRRQRQLLNELDRHSIEMIEGMIARGKVTEHENNASCLRMGVILDFLNREKVRRAKAQGVERDAPGRNR